MDFNFEQMPLMQVSPWFGIKITSPRSQYPLTALGSPSVSLSGKGIY